MENIYLVLIGDYPHILRGDALNLAGGVYLNSQIFSVNIQGGGIAVFIHIGQIGTLAFIIHAYHIHR